MASYDVTSTINQSLPTRCDFRFDVSTDGAQRVYPVWEQREARTRARANAPYTLAASSFLAWPWPPVPSSAQPDRLLNIV